MVGSADRRMAEGLVGLCAPTGFCVVSLLTAGLLSVLSFSFFICKNQVLGLAVSGLLSPSKIPARLGCLRRSSRSPLGPLNFALLESGLAATRLK